MADKKDLVADREARVTSAADRSVAARKNMADVTARTHDASLRAEGRADAATGRESTSFLSELGSTRSVLTGLAALGALATGNSDVAGGIALGGVMGTSQRADEINRQRTEGADKATKQEMDAHNQEIQLATAELASSDAENALQASLEGDLLKQIVGSEIELEIQSNQLSYARWAKESDQDYETRMNKVKNEQTIKMMRLSDDLETKQFFEKVKAQTGMEIEEVMDRGGLNVLDAELKIQMEKERAVIDTVHAKIREGTASELGDEFLSAVTGKSAAEMAKVEVENRRTRQVDAIRTDHLIKSLESGDTNATMKAMAAMGWDVNSQAMEDLARDASSFVAAGKLEEARALIMPTMIAGATVLSENSYHQALAAGADPIEASKLLIMQETPQGITLKNMADRKELVGRIANEFRDATVDERKNPAVFIQEHAGPDGAIIFDDTGGIEELVRYFASNDVVVSQNKFDAAMQHIMAREDYQDLSPKEAALEASKVAFATEQAGIRNYYQQTLIPAIEVKAAEVYDSILADTGSKMKAARGRDLISNMTLSLSNSQIKDVEAVEAVMDDVKGKITESLIAEDPNSAWTSFVDAMGMFNDSFQPMAYGVNPAVTTIVDAFAGWMFPPDKLKELEKDINNQAKSR